MRLFLYYALHSFKNQIRKLCRTWVLVFFLVCVLLGAGVGLFAAFLDDAGSPEPDISSGVEMEAGESEPGDSSVWIDGEDPEETPDLNDEIMDLISVRDLVELLVGLVILGVLVFFAMSADRNGSRIFLPADVTLLFPSPLKPQSVLLFRLATQLGVAVVSSLYLLFQVPNLTMNLGMSLPGALSLILVWGLTFLSGTLLQVLLYTLSGTHPGVKKHLRQGICLFVGVVGAGYLGYALHSGLGWLQAAAGFFNAPVSRFLPLWGWLKGICMYAMEGNAPGALGCLAALLTGGALLVFLLWRIPADFYEDAMAKSEETAELQARMQAERPSGVMVRRKKDRSEKLKRDGLNRGSGANIYFHKAMYNRFRFAHLGFLTRTMETYLATATAVGLLCRFVVHTASVTPVALTIGAMVFFRTLGNPLEQDTGMDWFVMIPESTWAKLFWSLLGGTTNCFLDVLPAVLLGALLTGESLLLALAWVPFIVSVDFYATCVGTFLGVSIPVSAGKMLKQVIQILFIYFGLLPDIALIALGMTFEHFVLSICGAAALNLYLGFLFFGLSPIFLEPREGRRRGVPRPFTGDLAQIRRRFSTLGFGVAVIFAASSVVQIGLGVLVGRLFPDGNAPSWLQWAATFVPIYVVGVPLGEKILRRVPAVQGEKRSLTPLQILSAWLISVFMMYSGNLLSTILLALFQEVSGRAPANPLIAMTTDDAVLLRVLVMVVLAPCIEEFVFRKTLIDRMRPYGEKTAVLTSALIFGLFHGNLSQMIYAFTLGLVFGYVYLRTGKLRYSMGLHMAVNFTGSVLGPFVLERAGSAFLEEVETVGTDALLAVIPLLVYGITMIAMALIGLVLLCIQARNVHFEEAEQELPRGSRLRTVLLNPGMLVLLALCALAVLANLLL